MTYYKRFQMDDFKELTEIFGKKPCREKEADRPIPEKAEP